MTGTGKLHLRKQRLREGRKFSEWAGAGLAGCKRSQVPPPSFPPKKTVRLFSTFFTGRLRFFRVLPSPAEFCSLGTRQAFIILLAWSGKPRGAYPAPGGWGGTRWPGRRWGRRGEPRDTRAPASWCCAQFQPRRNVNVSCFLLVWVGADLKQRCLPVF